MNGTHGRMSVVKVPRVRGNVKRTAVLVEPIYLIRETRSGSEILRLRDRRDIWFGLRHLAADNVIE